VPHFAGRVEHLSRLDTILATASAQAPMERRVGAGRVAAEPDPADQIITACARLPLALALVAARAATHPASRWPHWPPNSPTPPAPHPSGATPTT
jgi:hypothetical protein